MMVENGQNFQIDANQISKSPRIYSFLVTLIFVFTLILPFVLADKEGGKISVTERRYLAKFPVIRGEDSQFSRSIKGDFQIWLNDNLYSRLFLTKVKGILDYKVFHVSPTNLVQIGEAGWLFYKRDNNIQIAQGTNVPSAELLERIRNSQIAIQNALRKRGIDYILVLTPSKVSIYPEFILGGQYKVRRTAIDIVTDYLQTNTTIPVVNLKTTLLKAKSDSQVFLKTETHWNEIGAYKGYVSVIQTLNALGLTDTEPAKIATIEGLYKGEFSDMMGDSELIPPEPMLRTVIIKPKAIVVEDPTRSTVLHGFAESQHLLSDYVVQYMCLSCQKDLLLLGDSFFNTWNIPALFAENFHALNYVPTESVTKSLVDTTSPNIVILERTERFLYTLANDPDPYLVSEPLSDLRATIRVSYHQEDSSRVENQSINVIVKNTGKDSWSEKQFVRLCIFRDGGDLGLRILLPTDTIIRPSEEAHFFIPTIMLEENSPGKFSVKMVQEGYQYFGEEVVLSRND